MWCSFFVNSSSESILPSSCRFTPSCIYAMYFPPDYLLTNFQARMKSTTSNTTIQQIRKLINVIIIFIHVHHQVIVFGLDVQPVSCTNVTQIVKCEVIVQMHVVNFQKPGFSFLQVSYIDLLEFVKKIFLLIGHVISYVPRYCLRRIFLSSALS